MPHKNRVAFTLLELIIVIIIIGLVYGVFIFNGDFNKKEISKHGFKELKNTLLNLGISPPLKLVCRGDNCEDCKVISNDKDDVKIKLFTTEPQILEYDQHGYLGFKEYPDNYCFEFEIRKNLSSSNILVELNSKYYLFLKNHRLVPSNSFHTLKLHLYLFLKLSFHLNYTL